MSKKEIAPKTQQKQDETTLKLLFGYRKRCDFYGIVPNPVIKGKLDEVTQSGKNINGKLQMLHCSDEVGPMQIRAFMEVACDLQYEHLKKIRIWKGCIGDEGVRFISKFLTIRYSLDLIDLLDNEITPLGCEFIGKAMSSPFCNIKHLKLDDNLILSAGLKQLVVGLRQNNVIDKLSLKYCGIDAQGARYIQQILANISTNLRSLKLQGNHFGNEAIYQILRAVQTCDSLRKLNLADTGMQLLDYEPERQSLVQLIAEHLALIMKKNNNILKYDIRFNPMHNLIAQQLLKAIEGNLIIRKMEFPNNVSYDLRDALDTILRKRNKTKAKKAKKQKK